jgi:hypothetical protein
MVMNEAMNEIQTVNGVLVGSGGGCRIKGQMVIGTGSPWGSPRGSSRLEGGVNSLTQSIPRLMVILMLTQLTGVLDVGLGCWVGEVEGASSLGSINDHFLGQACVVREALVLSMGS